MYYGCENRIQEKTTILGKYDKVYLQALEIYNRNNYQNRMFTLSQ